MEKIKEIYSMWLDDNTVLDIEVARDKVKILKATKYEDDDIESSVYCKPNISFTILPGLDLKDQICYHLTQRDRIDRIHKKIEETKLMLIERYRTN